MVRDIALSHVMSRDHLLALRYFSSVTRLNARLRILVEHGLLTRLSTPFFSQSLYAPGHRAKFVVGERVELLLSGRKGTPRFVQHALAACNLRVALCGGGKAEWRFEQQSSATFSYAGRTFAVKPDGLVLTADAVVAVEADLGHAAPHRIREKLESYKAFALSGECRKAWSCDSFTVLTVTTGPLRAKRLRRIWPSKGAFDFTCQSHDEFGVAWPGSWS